MNIYHKIILCRNICPKYKISGILNRDLCGTVYNMFVKMKYKIMSIFNFIYKMLWFIIAHDDTSTMSLYEIFLTFANKCPNCKHKSLVINTHSHWNECYCDLCGYSYMDYFITSRFIKTGLYNSYINHQKIRSLKIKRLIKRNKPWYKRIF